MASPLLRKRRSPLNTALATVFFNFAKAREVLFKRTKKTIRAGGFLKKSGQFAHFTFRSNLAGLCARWCATRQGCGSSAKVSAGTHFRPQIFAALVFTKDCVNCGQGFCGAQCKAGFLIARAKFTANKAFKPLVALLLTGTSGFAGRPLTRRYQTEEGELLAICNEGVELLCLGRYEEFIDRFNYACSYDRDPVEALREDISIRLNEIGSQAISAENASRQGKVVFYKMNSENLIAVVSVPALAESGGEVLVEFVVTKVGSQNHVTLEDVSAVLA